MTIRTTGIVSLLALAAAACSQQSADDSNIAIDNAVNAAELANADVETLPPSESGGSPDMPEGNLSTRDPDQVGGMPVPPASGGAIPVQYRGRWGMNANDCDPRRSDAKGLITIDGSTIRFYEARAVLKEQRPAIATSFSGLFAFSGEGQTWEKVQTFTRTGDMLKRADDDGTYSYNRCA